jgi:hypothetical protein
MLYDEAIEALDEDISCFTGSAGVSGVSGLSFFSCLVGINST